MNLTLPKLAGKIGPSRQKQTPFSQPNAYNSVSPGFLTPDKVSLSNTLPRFQAKKGAVKNAQDKKADQQRAQREEDAAFLEERTEWFKENRPKEDETDGYVTTPGHSDDESRPTARRKAKETSREFDSNTQSFYKA
jgi:hypothetical protein